jgi:solute:Na+ symporter, SSS family
VTGVQTCALPISENRRDLLSLAFALPWQITIFMVGMAFMLKRWDYFAGLGALFLALSAGLYFFWYRRLSDE